MSYAVTTIQDELAGVLHGTTINKITNLGGLMNRAARQLLLECDPIETKRIVQLGKIFNSYYDYALPGDLKGTKVIDIRPQGGRYPSDQWEQSFARWFDAHKRNNWNNAFNIQHDTGAKTLRMEAPALTSPITLCDTGVATGWTATGTASNLTLDPINKVAGAGSIQFDVAAGTGSIQVSTLTPIDMTGYVNIANMFFWVYLPTVPTSMSLSWGSDNTANYYTYIPTAQADGTAFTTGWNQIGFAWTSASVVGSPTKTGYDAITLSIIAPSAMTGVRFCTLTSALGTYFEMMYYSKYLFSNGGVWKETITDLAGGDQTTVINLDTESYNLYFNLLAYMVCQQLMGADSGEDSQFFLTQYQKCLKRYTAANKSEVLLPSEPWYVLPKGNRGYNVGPRWQV